MAVDRTAVKDYLELFVDTIRRVMVQDNAFQPVGNPKTRVDYIELPDRTEVAHVIVHIFVKPIHHAG